jgi:hypothetical protein
LAGVYRFDEIRLDRPSLHLTRERSGALTIASAFAPKSPSVANVNEPAPLDLSIKHLALNDGGIALEDRVPHQAVSLDLTNLTATLDDFSTVGTAQARYAMRTSLKQGGTIAVTGALGVAAKRADARLTIDSLALPLAQPYLDDVTSARLADGSLGGSLSIDADWSKPATQLRVSTGELTLKSVKVMGPGTANGSAPAIALTQGRIAIKSVDVAGQSADIERVEATGLTVSGSRDKDGRISLAELAQPPRPIRTVPQRAAVSNSHAQVHGESEPAQAVEAKSTKSAGSTKATGSTKSAKETKTAQTGWRYRIGELILKDGAADITDAAAPVPAKLHLAPLQLDVRNVTEDMSRPLAIKLEASVNGKGTLNASGDIVPSPLDASLMVEANRLDLSPFEPYFGSQLNAKIAKAELNARGQVKAVIPKNGAPVYSYRGFAALVDVRLLDRTNSSPLAGWGTLGIGGINARYDEHGINLDIARVTFARFFGRVLLDAQGRLNLNDVLARQREASTEPAAKQKGATSTAQVQTSPPSTPSAPLHARIGQVVLQEGHVNYTDDFVKPNYKADLEDITGTIGTFGTDVAAPAPVDISASLADNGPIAIRGTANPLAPKPSLDLSASAHDVELKNLTPYSLKYAGYPITKGRLDVDLHYKLENDQLTAENHLVIDQLTFGDHVENPTETHLPVRLAIALLKDSHGKIDVRIPVSGSLSNPQFSLGSLIWGAVRHLIERAVTAPFSLLANALGAGGGSGSGNAEQLQYIAFAPGSAALTDASREKLDTLAKLLAEKPNVKLDLSGRADENVDMPGLRMAYVDDLVKREKAKASGNDGQHVDPSAITLTSDEYHRYLTQVYKDADFKKPRNFVGLTKTLPDDDMKRALAFHAPVNEASLQALADQRAQNVRQYLSGKVDESRVAIVAPHFGTEGMKDNGPSTRVDLAPAAS